MGCHLAEKECDPGSSTTTRSISQGMLRRQHRDPWLHLRSPPIRHTGIMPVRASQSSRPRRIRITRCRAHLWSMRRKRRRKGSLDFDRMTFFTRTRSRFDRGVIRWFQVAPRRTDFWLQVEVVSYCFVMTQVDTLGSEYWTVLDAFSRWIWYLGVHETVF